MNDKIRQSTWEIKDQIFKEHVYTKHLKQSNLKNIDSVQEYNNNYVHNSNNNRYKKILHAMTDIKINLITTN